MRKFVCVPHHGPHTSFATFVNPYPLAAPQAEQRAHEYLRLTHAQALKQVIANMEFKSTLPSIPSSLGPVTDKMKRSLQTLDRYLRDEKFAIETFGRGSINHLLAIANIERLKFRQLPTKEKRAWVKANSHNPIRSLPGWNSMTLGKKAEEILNDQIRAFGAMRQGPFASILTRNYIKEKRIVEWRMEVACRSDSMLPPDAPPDPQVEEPVSLPIEPNLRVGQTLGLVTQQHPQPSGASKESPICVLPEHIKKQEEKVYVLGITQPQSSTYRNAVGLLELMWFLSLEAGDRQVWINKYSTPTISRFVGWASKSEVEQAKIIIASRIKHLEYEASIPQVVPAIGRPTCGLFSIGKEADAANTNA